MIVNVSWSTHTDHGDSAMVLKQTPYQPWCDHITDKTVKFQSLSNWYVVFQMTETVITVIPNSYN